MLFGDRAWGWKVGAALAVAAAFGVHSYMHGTRVDPELWRCLTQPERWSGTRLRLHARIVGLTDAGYVVEQDLVRLPVRGLPPGPVGTWVEIRGTFRADGRLDAERARVPVAYPGGRPLVEIVSVLVLALVAANFFRHFRGRPSVLRLEGPP